MTNCPTIAVPAERCELAHIVEATGDTPNVTIATVKLPFEAVKSQLSEKLTRRPNRSAPCETKHASEVRRFMDEANTQYGDILRKLAD